MANKPFDYTITNPLERPSSSDLNQAQGQAHADVRLLAQKLFEASETPQDGFVGSSFKPSETFPGSDSVAIVGGVAFQTKAAENNIGGIAGVTDAFTYKALTIDTCEFLILTGAASPGMYRKDLLQVRAMQDTERLGGATVTDIYNPSLNTFGAAPRYKLLTSNLTGQVPQIVSGPNVGTAPVVVKQGVEGPVLAALTPPAPDPGYLPVAIVSWFDLPSIIGVTDARPILGLSADKLADNSVTTSKLVDGAVTTAKIADGSVTAAKIGTGQITPAKIGTIFAFDSAPATSFNSLTYTELFSLNITTTGDYMKIGLQSGGDYKFRGYNNISLDDRIISIKVEVTGPTTRDYIYTYGIMGLKYADVPPFHIMDIFSPGAYTIKLYGKVSHTSVTVDVDDVVLVAYQP